MLNRTGVLKTLRTATYSGCLALCVGMPFLPQLAQAQLSAVGAAASEKTITTPASIAEERARAEALLLEAQQQRESDFSGTREPHNAQSVQLADRQRLLDRLTFLHGERLKRLDELVALQEGAKTSVASLPVVQSLGEAPPYSALAVDALRDELAGQREKLRSLDSGLAIRESEKQVLADQLRRTEERLRLDTDRLSQADNEAARSAARRAHEQADLRRRIAEAELATLAIDVDKLKLQRSGLGKEVEELEALLARVIPNQRLSIAELTTLRERAALTSQQLLAERAKVQQRQSRHQNERERLLRQKPEAGSVAAQRLAFLDDALKTDGALLDGLQGLEMLTAVTIDVWEKRYIILAGNDAERQREALTSLKKIYEGLLGRKPLSQEQRNALAISIRDQETRLANLPPGSSEQQRGGEILGLLRERAKIQERLELGADRLERQLARWLDDFTEAAGSGVSQRAQDVVEQTRAWMRDFWQYELFAVEDVSEVEGRKVFVSYGVTVGKSIGALSLFVIGYWFFSRLAQLVQAILISRFGVDSQLASVIRRWAMIVLAIGLLIFILNLARIPLTVFAFMGGALAIGIGFGTQTIIKNFISGIIILFERKIRVGDIIQLADMTGHVTAVDLRATTVRGFNGVEALVPNSNFLENQVVNWTYSNQQIRRELQIGVAYGSDSRAVEAVVARAALDHPDVLKDPAPEVYFEDFADNALLMVLVYWVELGSGTVARRVDSDVRHTIYRRLAEAGIAIPFPQQDVHLDLRGPLPVVLAEAAS